MSESFDDQLSRLHLIASGDRDCDMSENDLNALRALLLTYESLVEAKSIPDVAGPETRTIEERHDDLGLDEVMAAVAHVHLERMSNSQFSLMIETAHERANYFIGSGRAHVRAHQVFREQSGSVSVSDGEASGSAHRSAAQEPSSSSDHDAAIALLTRLLANAQQYAKEDRTLGGSPLWDTYCKAYKNALEALKKVGGQDGENRDHPARATDYCSGVPDGGSAPRSGDQVTLTEHADAPPSASALRNLPPGRYGTCAGHPDRDDDHVADDLQARLGDALAEDSKR